MQEKDLPTCALVLLATARNLLIAPHDEACSACTIVPSARFIPCPSSETSLSPSPGWWVVCCYLRGQCSLTRQTKRDTTLSRRSHGAHTQSMLVYAGSPTQVETFPFPYRSNNAINLARLAQRLVSNAIAKSRDAGGANNKARKTFPRLRRRLVFLSPRTSRAMSCHAVQQWDKHNVNNGCMCRGKGGGGSASVVVER